MVGFGRLRGLFFCSLLRLPIPSSSAFTKSPFATGSGFQCIRLHLCAAAMCPAGRAIPSPPVPVRKPSATSFAPWAVLFHLKYALTRTADKSNELTISSIDLYNNARFFFFFLSVVSKRFFCTPGYCTFTNKTDNAYAKSNTLSAGPFNTID